MHVLHLVCIGIAFCQELQGFSGMASMDIGQGDYRSPKSWDVHRGGSYFSSHIAPGDFSNEYKQYKDEIEEAPFSMGAGFDGMDIAPPKSYNSFSNNKAVIYGVPYGSLETEKEGMSSVRKGAKYLTISPLPSLNSKVRNNGQRTNSLAIRWPSKPINDNFNGFGNFEKMNNIKFIGFEDFKKMNNIQFNGFKNSKKPGNTNSNGFENFMKSGKTNSNGFGNTNKMNNLKFTGFENFKLSGNTNGFGNRQNANNHFNKFQKSSNNYVNGFQDFTKSNNNYFKDFETPTKFGNNRLNSFENNQNRFKTMSFSVPSMHSSRTINMKMPAFGQPLKPQVVYDHKMNQMSTRNNFYMKNYDDRRFQGNPFTGKSNTSPQGKAFKPFVYKPFTFKNHQSNDFQYTPTFPTFKGFDSNGNKNNFASDTSNNQFSASFKRPWNNNFWEKPDYSEPSHTHRLYEKPVTDQRKQRNQDQIPQDQEHQNFRNFVQKFRIQSRAEGDHERKDQDVVDVSPRPAGHPPNFFLENMVPLRAVRKEETTQTSNEGLKDEFERVSFNQYMDRQTRQQEEYRSRKVDPRAKGFPEFGNQAQNRREDTYYSDEKRDQSDEKADRFNSNQDQRLVYEMIAEAMPIQQVRIKEMQVKREETVPEELAKSSGVEDKTMLVSHGRYSVPLKKYGLTEKLINGSPFGTGLHGALHVPKLKRFFKIFSKTPNNEQ